MQADMDVLSERRYADTMNARILAEQMANSVRIAWFYIPASLGESLHMNLLVTNAVLTSEHPRKGELPEKLAFFFSTATIGRSFAVINLDQFLNLSGARSMEQILKECRLLALALAGLPLDRVLLHTGYIDASLKEIFTERNIFLVQKNLSDAKFSLDFLRKLIPVFVPEIASLRRNYVRIFPDSDLRVRMEFTRRAESHPPIHGSIADIGLGGLSVILNSETTAPLDLREVVRLQVYLPRGSVKITAAVIVWKNEETGRVGLFFDPDDPRMISGEDVDTLAFYVYTRIKMARKALRETA